MNSNSSSHKKAKRPRWRKVILVFFILLALVGGAFGAALYFAPRPPMLLFAKTRDALSQARQKGAQLYAPQLMHSAESRWKQANSIWQRENQEWFFLRNYGVAQKFAQEAITQADSASARATAVRDSLRQMAFLGILVLKQQIKEFEPEFDSLPLTRAVRQQFGAGQLLVLESEEAYNREDYYASVARLQKAATCIENAGSHVSDMLEDYLSNMPKWKRWARETIAWSAQNNAPAIIVDKMAHVCQIYNNGRLKAEYPVELGPSWLGHKRREGDKATPEGRYLIKKKKGPGNSKYYKALEINYPNEQDRANFLEAKRKGLLPASARIGSLIEIHGDGGRGANWTSGCVALRNEHIDKIFDLVIVGTPVTIVGSLNGHNSINHSSLDLSTKGLSGAANLSSLSENRRESGQMKNGK